ncbi:Elongation factor Ts, mitochondrial [Microbotryomycetes sp. JL201]|nr:Elongation factor Ts, mitochondrial [Microbotryomycetes sp. JL201]
MTRPSTRCLRRLTSLLSAKPAPRPGLFAADLQARASTSSSTPSVPIKLISELRARRPGTPLSNARTALASSGNDVAAALQWLDKQAATQGAAKQAKLQSREANQGLVGVAVLADGISKQTGVRAAVVELRCETDFVARTDEFRALAEQIARSVAFFAEAANRPDDKLAFADVELKDVLAIPVVPPPHATTNSHVSEANHSTVNESIQAAISKLGENITLHRVSSVATDPVTRPGALPMHVVSPFLHGSVKTSTDDPTFQSGTLAGLVLCRISAGQSEAVSVDSQDVQKLARALARQVVALPTFSVTSSGTEHSLESAEQSTALYDQSMMTMASSPLLEFEQGASVRDVLRLWNKAKGLDSSAGFEVLDVKRWRVGAE